VLAGIALACVALAACGGSGPSGDGGGGTPADVGVPARLASCADWRRASPVQRRGTIRQITAFARGQVESPNGAGHGATLTDRQAYALFQRWCSLSFAGQFKLYKLYTRAAAFTKQP
jgi:hypothetical protein